MRAFLVSVLGALTLAISTCTAWAALSGGAPDALLSSQDRRHQEQALQNALEFNKTGQATAWDNPETGHRGKIVPTLTYRNWAGQNCRQFHKELTVDGNMATGSGTRCRTGYGAWVTPMAPPPDYDYPYYPYAYDYPYPYPYGYYRPYPYYYRPYYYPFTFSFYYGFGSRRHWGGGHGHWRHHH